MPLSPGGIIPAEMNDRQWARYVAQSGIQADASVHTFTPTWTGFALDPTGDMSYMDFGAIVMMWTTVGFSGNSNATTFTIGNFPEAIRPSGVRSVKVLAFDNGLIIRDASMDVSGGSGAGFALANVPAAPGPVNYLLSGWTNAGVKGLPPGFIAIYAK